MALPKLSELISQTSKLADETFSNANWVAWFNDALDDLIEVIDLETSAELTKEASALYFDLPSDFKTEIRVCGTEPDEYGDVLVYDKLDVNDMENTGYKIYNNRLYIQGVSDVTAVNLYYYKYPTKFAVADMDATPDIPEAYVEAIKLFAAMRALQSADELQRADVMEDQYYKKKANIMVLNGRKRPARLGYWKVNR